MIRVGVAGWDYPDWEGAVYPAPSPRGLDRLRFLATYFDAIEINVTFYRQPDARACRSWVTRVPLGGSFRFTAKLHRSLTHPGRPPERSGRLSEEDLRAAADLYRAGIDPLLGSGLLGAVLMQFPHSFHNVGKNREHLERLAALLAGLPLVAEFRHRGWDREEALRLLRDLGIGFCNIDQPALGSTLPPTEHLTSGIAYVRLHGRNARAWFRPADSPASRYDYLYSVEELRPWVERARRLGERAEEVFIIANNHYRGKGPANALMLASALAGRRMRAPKDLVEAYPALQEVAVPEPPGPAQRRLF